MCVPNSPLFPFSALPGIWLAPFFQQKVYEWPNFSGFLCERPHFSNILVYAHIFRSEIFWGCLSSWYYMNWLWYLSNNQQKMGTKKSKGSIWIGQHCGWSSIWMGPLFQRPGICITKTRLFKYIENCTTKNGKISRQTLRYFSYFCSKHRLWVLVRTASSRRF